jgi:hypothetical protein
MAQFSDASSNGLHLLLTAPSEWTQQVGAMPNGNNCMKPSDENAYAKVLDPTNKLNVNYMGDISVVCWLKWTTSTAVRYILDYANKTPGGTNYQWRFLLNANDTFQFYTWNSSFGGGTPKNRSSTVQTSKVGTWVFVIAQVTTPWQQAPQADIYINNVLSNGAASASLNGPNDFSPNMAMYFGRDFNSGTTDLGETDGGGSALIGKVAVVNKLLTPLEKSNLYSAMTHV